ncbi:MAG: carboxypeptidase-like regulatory domain-containing protein [Bacteroidota bacterium]
MAGFSRWALLPCLFLLFQSTLAQPVNHPKLTGVVLDQHSGKSIEYATVFLKNHQQLGGTTDSIGRFSFAVPEALANDTLLISYIGYEHLQIPLATLDDWKETNRFKLKRTSTVLKEIVFRDSTIDLYKVFQKALSNSSKHYPNRRHQLKGFFRKVSTEDKLYTYLEEAIVTIEDYKYGPETSDYRIQLEAIRSSKEYGNIDTTVIKAFNRVGANTPANARGAKNPLSRLYECNHLRHFRNSLYRFYHKRPLPYIRKYHWFELMDMTVVNNDTILQIACSGGRTPLKPTGSSYVKVNLSDMAMVEYRLSVVADVFIVKFRKNGDRYYPHFIKLIKPRYINRNIDDAEYDIMTFWFDPPVTKDFVKIKGRSLIGRYDVFAYKNKPYDALYWQDLEWLKRYPLDESIQQSLEREMPLDKQFRHDPKLSGYSGN